MLGVVVASLLATHEVGAVKPLDNTDEFLMGAFRMPETPPVEGPIPARLQSPDALPRDRCALTKGVWLRFQNFGAERYKGWSAQMQIDDQGNIYLVSHLGDATPDKVKNPAWPARPTQKLDAATLADLKKKAAAFAAGPAYRGHEGLSYAPTFVITVAVGGVEREVIAEAYENDFIAHLRRITSFAQKTPLKGGSAGGGKARPAKRTDKKAP
jgi:hypothetical protein